MHVEGAGLDAQHLAGRSNTDQPIDFTIDDGGGLIICGDDPWSDSTQVPADSRYLAEHVRMPTIEPSSPQEVKDWIKFAQANDGTLPCFPLPLGDPSVPCGGEMLTVRLMDKHQSERFESACLSAGARVIGGVIACAALAEHELTGEAVYNVITPTTTRRTPAEFMTTGWFTGVVPISVPVVPESFGDTARAMQKAFDAGMDLAHVPFERVLELAEGKVPGIRKADPGVPMVSYLDTNLPPLSPAIMNEWERLNGRVYSDARSAYQIGIWVNRSEKETSVTIAYPDNPIARESVDKYLHAMRAVYLRVADGGSGAGRSDALRHNGCRSELIRAVKG